MHGNGFIQVDIAPDVRMHVWDVWPDFPAQKVRTPIHNHTFSFTSRVIKGCLHNRIFRLVRGKEYRFYQTIRGQLQQTELSPVDFTTSIEVIREQIIDSGSTYQFPAGMFHESIPLDSPTITVMTITEQGAAGPGPFVLVPPNIEPDNDFNRYQYSEDELDALVLKALKA